MTGRHKSPGRLESAGKLPCYSWWMKNIYPFHIDYARALTSGDIPALRKLIRRALRAKPQMEFFTGDGTRKGLTRFEELATAVWRTFDAGHFEHARLFLAAGLPVDILMPDVDGISWDTLWTPLDVTLFAGDGDEGGKLQLTKMLLAVGANTQRQFCSLDGQEYQTPALVRTIAAARALWEYGVPTQAFVKLPSHVIARI